MGGRAGSGAAKGGRSARRGEAREPSDLTRLRGVGPARERALERLGIRRVRDLMLLIPRRIEVWGEPQPIEAALAAGPGGEALTIGGVVQRWSFFRRGRRRSLLRLWVDDGSAEIEALFFNQPWLRERFTKGERVELHGRVAAGKQRPVFAVSRLFTEERPRPAPGTVDPIYPTAEGLAQGLLRGLCAQAAEEFADELSEPLGAAELGGLELPPLPAAVRRLHLPRSAEEFAAARRRVALEALLALQARLHGRRSRRAEGSAPALVLEADEQAELLERLPFEPTSDQSRAIDELRRDLARTAPMRRLLQGDVGTGKTLVGLYACQVAAARGVQAAFMAPTEILVEQHAAGLAPALERAGIRSAVLTASLVPARRKRVLEQLAGGTLDLVFGTHALFSGDVRFHRLGLAVIDEQHRFGVTQRERLLEKGRDVHALLMTATPIPRSLALSIYGDLELSVLRERPPGRGEVSTRWLRGPEAKRLPELLERRLSTGGRVFWVVPRIDDAEDGAPGVLTRCARLRDHALARHGIELVHGRMPAAERARRLRRLRRGEVGLLVATTVIEVGVDVPEATAMVIEGAERFGLAQLHQLRGRVGRGGAGAGPSECLLLAGESAAERLELFERTGDGFELAEEDLRRRGMGDLAGLRQSGDNAEGLEDPFADADLLFAARDLVRADPVLLAHYDGGAPPAC